MKYKLKVYCDEVFDKITSDYNSLYDIVKKYYKYFDTDYLRELFLLDKNNSLNTKDVLYNLLWILDDYYKDFSKIEILNKNDEIVDSIERDTLNFNKGLYKIKFYYNNRIHLSNFSGNSIKELYYNYCNYLLDKNNNSIEYEKIISKLYVQEYFKSKKQLKKIQILDPYYKVINEINNLELNKNLAFKISFENNYSIYDYEAFYDLKELFTKYSSNDTLEILIRFFKENYKKYKKISSIDIVNLEDYSIIDSYNISAINRGYIYRLRIIFKDSIRYEGYYSSIKDFIEDLECFYERDKIDNLLSNENLFTFEDIIKMNKQIYKDANEIQIIKIDNNKSTVVL